MAEGVDAEKSPLMYEAHAAVFLNRMRRRYGPSVTLASVPDEEWKALKRQGFTWIWLMGVWQRSPAARQEASTRAELRDAYARLIPNWKEEDAWGSPYAIYTYRLDKRLGDPSGELPALKSKLNRLGMKLMLDFVPNHFAMDHPWTREFPERFFKAPEPLVKARPEWFFKAPGGEHLARGRDPYFPPWSDTVQVNIFSEETRLAMRQELMTVAENCDGVRCDMAMLLLNKVFAGVWRECLAPDPLPLTEFWAEAIDAVKRRYPSFVFLAEVYWDLEADLIELGFDFVYDKKVYDKLRSKEAGRLKAHLRGTEGFRYHGAHFTENHDEERAVTAFGREASLAAAAAAFTLPGMRFVHDGQIEGREQKHPIHFSREGRRHPAPAVRAFYDRLFSALRRPLFHEGKWSLWNLFPEALEEEEPPLLSWGWRWRHDWAWVLINYSHQPLRIKVTAPAGIRVKGGRAVLDLLSEEASSGSIPETPFELAMKPWESRIWVPAP